MAENQRKASFEDKDLRKIKKGPADGGKGKKKNLRTLLIALAAMVVVGGAAYAAVNLIAAPEAEEPAATPQGPDLSIIASKRDEIDTITLTSQNGTITISRDASTGTYTMKEFPEGDLDQSLADTLFFQTASLTGQELVEENAADLAPYGLDRPAAQLDVLFTDGTRRFFHIGDNVGVIAQTYFMEEGSNRVVTIWTSISGSYTRTSDAYMKAALPELAEVDYITYVRAETAGSTLELRLKESDNNALTLALWELTEPWRVDCDGEKAAAWMENLANVTPSGYAGSLKKDGEAKFGLDAPGGRLTARDSDGGLLDIRIGLTREDGKAYINEVGQDAVLLIDASKLSFLSVSPLTVIDRFANLYRIDFVDRYSIRAGGETHSFSIEREPAFDEAGVRKTDANGNPTFNETFFYGSTEVPDKAFKRYYQVLVGVLIDGVAERAPESETAALEINYHLTAEKGGGTRVVKYYPYDRDFYLIETDGTRRFIVRRESVDKILTRLEDIRTGNYAAFDNTTY